MMEDLTLGGEAVFGPDLLVVDEGALLRAKKVVLEGGEWGRAIVGHRVQGLLLNERLNR